MSAEAANYLFLKMWLAVEMAIASHVVGLLMGSAEAWTTRIGMARLKVPTIPSFMPLFASTASSPDLDTPEQTGRDISSLLSWANAQGVETNNLSLEEADSLEGCFGVTASDETQPMTRVLKVPAKLIFSSERIRDEFQAAYGHDDLLPAIQHIQATQYRSQLSHFYLYLKILVESEKLDKSFWYPWFQSLPKSFDTAVAMDTQELEWLPPYAWALANVERKHLEVFHEALKKLPQHVLSNKVIEDSELIEWAFQVVFTRAWRYLEDSKSNKNNTTPTANNEYDERCDIVPFGDMFNHCTNKNLELDYDADDNFLAYTAHAVSAGAPLHISYGRPTNPYRFLTIFGFCDTEMPEIFSQITLESPSKRHVELGYDLDTMVFRTQDGAIANAVWDVLLYTILEQKPELQELFYLAHVNGDTNTKQAMHVAFHLENCLTLKSHVDRTLTEMDEILAKMDQVEASEKRLHPRYNLIRTNNEFVRGVFGMVKQRVDGMIQAEVLRRRDSVPA